MLALLATPAAAPAATVRVEGGMLLFTGEPREANHPTFHHRAEDELVVHDPRFPGPSVTAGAGCAQDGDNTVLCPRGGVTQADFALGAGGGAGFAPDSLTLTEAVPVPVRLTAADDSGARVVYLDPRPVQVLLDGVANDGPAGRGDQIGPGVDDVTTGDGDDTIRGNAAANTLTGSWGRDRIAGEGGDDTLTLASYNDVGADAVGLETHGTDSASCGAGHDTVYFETADRLTADCEILVLVSDSGFGYRSTSSADRIIADRGPATVRGADGADRLGAARGIGGVVLIGGAGDDRLAGNADDDRLDGGSGDDSLVGAEGADRLTGGPGRDSVSGGAGADTIFVREGFTDTVRCGSGRDTVSADRRDRVARDCERVRRR